MEETNMIQNTDSYNYNLSIMTVDLEPDIKPDSFESINSFLPKLLNLFDDHKVKATFFTVTSLLPKFEDQIREIRQKHEIASHSHTHSSLTKENSDFEIKTSMHTLKEFNINCTGFRAPRFITTDNHLHILKQHGYKYDSSFGRWLPGRYRNLTLPNKPFMKNGILEFPMPNIIYPFIDSGLPYLRLLHPLSRIFPQRYMFYLHLWEFLKPSQLPAQGIISKLLKVNAGETGWQIFQKYVERATNSNRKFISCEEWIDTCPSIN